MIFVTTGTDPRGFERLVRKMDEIAGEFEGEVIMQIGGTRYVPINAQYFDFATEQEMRVLYEKAEVVVTHGGVGTILDVLEQGTSVVVVPRLKKYAEVIDDHQLYLVQELEKAGKITAVYDVEGLEEALKGTNAEPAKLVHDRRLVNALRRYVAEFERNEETVSVR